MRKTWFALPAAGLLATACAHGGNSQNPTANAVETNQRQSAEALKQAHDAQQKAMEQQQKVASAEQDVQKSQQELQQAQEKLKQEQAKSRELQQHANQLTQQSAEQAQERQQDAMTALQRQQQQIQSGQQTFSGQVASARSNELRVKPRDGGQPMTFRITNDTRVLVDGQQGSIDQILQGEDARVSYELGGTTPRATSVLVQTGSPAGGMHSSGGSSSSSTGTGSSNSSSDTGSSSSGSGSGGSRY